jgi:hypothetical protein
MFLYFSYKFDHFFKKILTEKKIKTNYNMKRNSLSPKINTVLHCSYLTFDCLFYLKIFMIDIFIIIR